MKSLCKGCCEYFTDFMGSEYCELCAMEIESGEDGWLELNEEEGGKNGKRI